MFEYIYRDMMSMVRYLPYGLVMGLFLSVLLWWTFGRQKRQEGKVSRLPAAAFWIYLSMMLIITFLSRESGSRKGVDLTLFSTWGINDRNNAFVIENILLFVPYGFLGCLAFKRLRHFWRCLEAGAIVSLCIETLQLITGRGFFQIDDILTNTAGAVLGFVLYKLAVLPGKK